MFLASEEESYDYHYVRFYTSPFNYERGDANIIALVVLVTNNLRLSLAILLYV